MERTGRRDAFDSFAIRVSAATVLLVGLVTLSSVGIGPLGFRSNLGHFFPEGWKLFAEPPAAPRFRAAVQRNGRWRDATQLPLARASNAFGLDRAVRWQSLEITRLVFESPKLDGWTPCDRGMLRCLAEAERRGGVAHRATNKTPYETLCGRVGLIRQLIDPPGSGADDPVRTTHVLVADIQC